MRRTQFAVVPASARVSYGAQGEGWHATIADLERPPNMSDATMFLACYVMISRARSFDGLLFLRLAKRSELGIGAPQHLLDEVNRLLVVEKSSTAALKAYLERICGGMCFVYLG